MRTLPGSSLYWRLVRTWRRTSWAQRVALLLTVALAATGVVLVVQRLSTPKQFRADEYDGRTWFPSQGGDSTSMVLINGITGHAEAQSIVNEPLEDPVFLGSSGGRTVMRARTGSTVLVLDDGTHVVRSGKQKEKGAAALLPAFLVTNGKQLVVQRLQGNTLDDAGRTVSIEGDAGASGGDRSIVSDGSTVWALRKGSRGTSVTELRQTKNFDIESRVLRSGFDDNTRLVLVDGRPYVSSSGSLTEVLGGRSLPSSDLVPVVAQSTGGLWAVARGSVLKYWIGAAEQPEVRLDRDVTRIAIWFGTIYFVTKDGSLHIVDASTATAASARTSDGKVPTFDRAPDVFVDGGRLWLHSGRLTASVDVRQRVTWINLLTESLNVCVGLCADTNQTTSSSPQSSVPRSSTTLAPGDTAPDTLPQLVTTTTAASAERTSTTQAQSTSTVAETMVTTTVDPPSSDEVPTTVPDSVVDTDPPPTQPPGPKGSLVLEFGDSDRVVEPVSGESGGYTYPSVTVRVGFKGDRARCKTSEAEDDGTRIGTLTVSGVSQTSIPVSITIDGDNDKGTWETNVSVALGDPATGAAAVGRYLRLTKLELCGMQTSSDDFKVLAPANPWVGDITSVDQHQVDADATFSAQMVVPNGWKPSATWGVQADGCSGESGGGDLSLGDGVNGSTSFTVNYDCPGVHTITLTVTFVDHDAETQSRQVSVTVDTAAPTTTISTENLLLLQWADGGDDSVVLKPGDKVTVRARYSGGKKCPTGETGWKYSLTLTSPSAGELASKSNGSGDFNNGKFAQISLIIPDIAAEETVTATFAVCGLNRTLQRRVVPPPPPDTTIPPETTSPGVDTSGPTGVTGP